MLTEKANLPVQTPIQYGVDQKGKLVLAFDDIKAAYNSVPRPEI